MRLSTIMLVVGTRPEAIKCAPVSDALIARGFHVQLALTGQHPGLDPTVYGFASADLLRLGCQAGKDPRHHAELVATALQPALAGPEAPDLVIVQGDTSSALGGALGAAAARISLAHVEAGLRSFDLALPWPEEGNRVAIDELSDLLFAATDGNADNLRAEGCGGEIHVTGNTAIDALFRIVGELPPRLLDARRPPRMLVTCHRRENWGTAFLPIGLALIELARSARLRIEVVLHSNPAMADVARKLLGGQQGIRLLPPMDHRTMVGTMRSASLILSDSGGIQEEAPALGVPLLVLRTKTERPEGVACGNSRLVGNDRDTILREVRRLLEGPTAYRAMAVPALPFGDGKASERIAAHVEDWLVRQGRQRRRAIA